MFNAKQQVAFTPASIVRLFIVNNLPEPESGYRQFSNEAIDVVFNRIVIESRKDMALTLEKCLPVTKWMA